MDSLIAGYLELARSTRGEPRQALDLDALLASLAAEAAADQSITYAGRGQPVMIEAAALTLRQILANLIGNALVYGSGQAVTLHLEDDEGALRIVVRDRGPGIAEDQLDKVFRPFYRVEASRSAAGGGAGLGLAIVQQLAQSQGWRVRLENRVENGGVAGLDAIVVVPRAAGG